MRVVSRLSCGVSGGRIVGSRWASIVLPVPGRADHQDVVSAGGGDHEGPLGRSPGRGRRRSRRRTGSSRGSMSAMPRPAGSSTIGRKACRPLRPGCRRRRPASSSTTAASRALATGTSSRRTPRSRAAIAIDSAPFIGRTLPSRASSPTVAEVVQLLRQKLPGGHQQAQRDRQVERRRRLSQVGRGQVDDGAAVAGVVAEVAQGPLDPVDALPDGRLRQADQHRLGQAGERIVDLHLDRHGVDPDQGECVQLGEHRRGSRGVGRGT